MGATFGPVALNHGSQGLFCCFQMTFTAPFLPTVKVSSWLLSDWNTAAIPDRPTAKPGSVRRSGLATQGAVVGLPRVVHRPVLAHPEDFELVAEWLEYGGNRCTRLRQPGHRFFFQPEEVEPIAPPLEGP